MSERLELVPAADCSRCEGGIAKAHAVSVLEVQNSRLYRASLNEDLEFALLELRGHGRVAIPENVHPDAFELDVTPNEAVTIWVEGEPISSSNGRLLLIHPGQRHYGEFMIDGIYTGFSLFIRKQALVPGVFFGSHSFVLDGKQRIQRLFSLIADELATAQHFIPDGFTMGALRVLIEELREKVAHAFLPLGLARARELIREDPSRDITVDELAKVASMSKYHFIRRFRNLTGKTPKQMILDARLEHAAHLLRSNLGMSVTEIAHEAGFGDLSAFERRFRARYLVSPREYRRNAEPTLAPLPVDVDARRRAHRTPGRTRA